MIHEFRNRQHAGQLLAEKLVEFADREDAIVLALPRGGVPVGFELAKRLRLPLDVVVVRKLGVPGHSELAMGAVASGGVRVLHRDLIAQVGIGEEEIELVTRRELEELARRESAYRSGRPHPLLARRTVLLVDDGVATGSTMEAAIDALRQHHPKAIVVAVPTIAASTKAELREQADDVVSVIAPHFFRSVGEWYADFSQTTDEEVTQILDEAAGGAAEQRRE
jgi:putative phosphoribosyl transferase